MTMLDRHTILADLYTVPGLGEHIVSLTVDDHECRALVNVQPRSERYQPAETRALQVAQDLLDNAVVSTTDRGTSGVLHVHVAGTYRGVPFRVVSVLDEEQTDRVRDLPDNEVVGALPQLSHVNETSTGGYLAREPIPGETYRGATDETREAP